MTASSHGGRAPGWVMCQGVPGGTILCYVFQDTRQICLNLKWKRVEEREVKVDDIAVNPDCSGAISRF